MRRNLSSITRTALIGALLACWPVVAPAVILPQGAPGQVTTADQGAYNPATAQTMDAQGRPRQTGRIEWGLWVDPDGCMHWWADGGLEGYMVPRRDPKTGRAVCLKQNTCGVENSDTLFATNSASITRQGRARLEQLFRTRGVFGFAVYGHTDAVASDSYNMALGLRRAKAVAAVAQSLGVRVERVESLGKRDPSASNATSAGRQANRRVEIVCYRW